MNVEIGERNMGTCKEVQTMLIHREGVKMVARIVQCPAFNCRTCQAKNMVTEKTGALSRSVIFYGAEILNW
jgi:hypothetical protein